jgi:hypothetical protein
VGAKATFIFDCKGYKDVWATVDSRDGLCRGRPIRKELYVLRLLLRSVALYRCCLNNCVTVNRGNNGIHHEVPSFREEI